MATDIYLKLDGIKGESRDDKHKDEIDIESWSWGMSQSGSTHGGGGSGTAKVSVQDLHFNKKMDKSSPDLAKYCAEGKHIAKGWLYQRKAGTKEPLEFIKIDLKDIIVSSYQTSSHGEQPSDSFSLNFAEFKFVYTVQTKEGGKGDSTEVSYNIPENKFT